MKMDKTKYRVINKMFTSMYFLPYQHYDLDILNMHKPKQITSLGMFWSITSALLHLQSQLEIVPASRYNIF
jgi:hypothetical protein